MNSWKTIIKCSCELYITLLCILLRLGEKGGNGRQTFIFEKPRSVKKMHSQNYLGGWKITLPKMLKWLKAKSKHC